MIKRVIVFDLDETLGYFTQIYCLKELIENKINNQLKKEELFKIFDAYPKIFRTDIFKALRLLKKIKKKYDDIRIMIYTNNNGPKNWVFNVKDYIEYKLKYKLFDKIIPAWKVNSDIYANCRTTHMKTYEDLRNCGNLTFKDKIMFIDDRNHIYLKHMNIKYLQVKPYVYEYKLKKFNDILKNIKFISKLSLDINNIRYCFNDARNINNANNIIKNIKKFINIKTHTKKHKKLNKKKQTKKKKQHGGFSLEMGVGVSFLVALYSLLNNNELNIPKKEEIEEMILRLKNINMIDSEKNKLLNKLNNEINKLDRNTINDVYGRIKEQGNNMNNNISNIYNESRDEYMKLKKQALKNEQKNKDMSNEIKKQLKGELDGMGIMVNDEQFKKRYEDKLIDRYTKSDNELLNKQRDIKMSKLNEQWENEKIKIRERLLSMRRDEALRMLSKLDEGKLDKNEINELRKLINN